MLCLYYHGPPSEHVCMCTCIWGSWSWKEWPEWLCKGAALSRWLPFRRRSQRKCRQLPECKAGLASPVRHTRSAFLCNLFWLSSCWELSQAKPSPNPESPSPLNLNHNNLLLNVSPRFHFYWKLSRVLLFSFVHTQDDFMGEHPFFRKYFLQKSIFVAKAVDSLLLSPWALPFHYPLEQWPTAHLSIFLPEDFLWTQEPSLLMHGADQKCQGIKSPPLSSPQSMTGENCCLHTTSFAPGLPGFSGGIELQLPKKWLEASLPFMSPLLMSYQCFLGLLPQQTTYTQFLVSATAYGGTRTKIVFLRNMLDSHLPFTPAVSYKGISFAFSSALWSWCWHAPSGSWYPSLWESLWGNSCQHNKLWHEKRKCHGFL